jgi:hypothetical protein
LKDEGKMTSKISTRKAGTLARRKIDTRVFPLTDEELFLFFVQRGMWLWLNCLAQTGSVSGGAATCSSISGAGRAS